MAEAVAEGAKEAGADVSLLTCAEVNGISAYDAVALGCPAMGAEELEDSEFLPMLEGIEPALPGKKITLFGFYVWGDGEWMRTWEERCTEKGITLAADNMCHKASVLVQVFIYMSILLGSGYKGSKHNKTNKRSAGKRRKSEFTVWRLCVILDPE